LRRCSSLHGGQVASFQMHIVLRSVSAILSNPADFFQTTTIDPPRPLLNLPLGGGVQVSFNQFPGPRFFQHLWTLRYFFGFQLVPTPVPPSRKLFAWICIPPGPRPPQVLPFGLRSFLIPPVFFSIARFEPLIPGPGVLLILGRTFRDQAK